MSVPRPVVLLILDGWGVNPNPEANAIAQARTPTLDALYRSCPWTTIQASEDDVGLPEGQMGNSEVGHQNMGAGFIVYQELTRLDKAIADESFYANPTLVAACAHARERGTALHLFGLLGPGGVHSHWAHLYALLRLARRQGLTRVYYHAFSDGRDTPPQSGEDFMAQVEAQMAEIGVGAVATVSGRYYAMDRDKRWERIERAYNAIVRGQGLKAGSARAAVQQSYASNVTDEFIEPTVIEQDGLPVATLGDGDAVIFFNFRGDRGRELTKALLLPEFDGFDRGTPLKDLYYVTLTQYEEGLPVHIAYETMEVHNPLARLLSERGLRQYHTAETEKYAHVTFFFNGRREPPFPGEDRLLVPSPKVATYDLQPEMSAHSVTDALIEHLRSGVYDFAVCNFANGDMVGHTGVLPAAIQAVETADDCLRRVIAAIVEAGGVAIVTADHGNAEEMIDRATGAPMTAHTTNPVPCVLVSPADGIFRYGKIPADYVLSSLAPTILDLLGLETPSEMTSPSLVRSSSR